MAYFLNELKNRILSFDPSGYNPSSIAASKTRAGEIPNYSTEVQLEKAAAAVVKNKTTEQNQENAKNGMVGGVLPVFGIGTGEPIRLGNQWNFGDVANQVVREKVADSKRSPSPQYDPYRDINQLTETLKQQQEEERAKFERKRMADRISRMGFALGNLIGANGGNSDASAITLDDGSRQVGEYRKDMEDINKENQAAYQRALDQIYRKEDQAYKNAVLAENRRNNEASLAATQEWREGQLKLGQDKLDETKRMNDAKIQKMEDEIKAKWGSLNVQQQNAMLREKNLWLKQNGYEYEYVRDEKGRVIKRRVIFNYDPNTTPNNTTNNTTPANGGRNNKKANPMGSQKQPNPMG